MRRQAAAQCLGVDFATPNQPDSCGSVRLGGVPDPAAVSVQIVVVRSLWEGLDQSPGPILSKVTKGKSLVRQVDCGPCPPVSQVGPAFDSARACKCLFDRNVDHL